MPSPPTAHPDPAGSMGTEELCRTIQSVDPSQLLALFMDAEGANAEPLALTEAALPVGSPAHFVQVLEGRGEIPEAARAGMIALFRKMEAIANAAAQVTPGTAKLIQGNITDPKAGTSFPHIVVFNGAQSAEDEACRWEQYKTKKTEIKVQLQDEQGAPPPIVPPREPSGPRSKAYQSLSLASNRHAPCLWQASLSWEARCRRTAWSFS